MPGKRETAALARMKATSTGPAAAIVPAKDVYAYAVVVMPSDGLGYTTARLLRFKVNALDGEAVGADDVQDLVISRAVDSIEDQMVFR